MAVALPRMTELDKIDIQSADGVPSRLSVFRAVDPEALVVICMPAMGVRAAHYQGLARCLAER